MERRISLPVRLFIGTILSLVVLTSAGMTGQVIAQANDHHKYPPPGSLVNVGGHMLHIHCMGVGSPTVVMEAGIGTWSIFWSRVQPEIAQTTRTCTYDRAGYGWSEAGSRPRTGQTITDELHTLLSEAGIEGPYVLVGHSFGGYIARLYVDRFPSDIMGVVLVDAAHPDLLTRLPPDYAQLIESGPRQYRFLSIIARAGLVRWAGKGSIPKVNLPLDMQPVYYAVMSDPGYYTTFADEIESFRVTADQAGATGSLEGIPLVVLTASDNSLDPDTLPPDFPAERANEVWQELQVELVELSSAGTHTIVPDTGHNIHLDQPAYVIDAVLHVLERARAGDE